MHPLTITRTVYDPATRDFVFDSAESKALPNIRQWINNNNPVIYWYVLRVDNQSELQLDQWAIELYTHQALNITEAYIDGIDRRFELKKRENDSWSDKYVLSIPKQLGIPIVGKGTRRIFFKVDINCREGLMHEYGISGRFIAHGVEPVDIKEKFFHYSCKVGEFRQIFNNNPDEASVYAEKRLSTRYSDNDVHLFTNSFRMIHDLYRYCHSDSIKKEELMNKLQLLYANFEKVPNIAKDKINPLLHDGIRELELIRNIDTFKPRYIRLCDSLVELLYIEVMSADSHKRAIAAQESETQSSVTGYVSDDDKVLRQDNHTADTGNRECPLCQNIIDQSNKLLICQECNARFCHTCEGWFREPRKTGEGPLCEKCFTEQRESLWKENEKKELLRRQREEEERKRREQEELERLKAQETARLKAAEEAERKRKAEESERNQQDEERLQKEREKQARLFKEQEEKRRKEAELKTKEAMRLKAAEEAERKRQKKKMIFIPVMIIIVLAGYWMFSPLIADNSGNQKTVVPQNTEVIESSLAAAEATDDSTPNTYTNSIDMEFVLIPAGKFAMGSNEYNDEQPVHEVIIEQAYYLGKYEVTQAQWVEVMGPNPSSFKGDNNPVEQVSWNDVQEFVKKLNAKEDTNKYRLPSEAEWEYACRAGTTTEYSFGDSESKLGDYAWYGDNSDSKTYQVGQKKANLWGLYDMHGNVAEWVQDTYHDSYNGASADGSAWEDSSSYFRVKRGGSWNGNAGNCRSAFRFNVDPDYRYYGIGFRLLRAV